MLILAAWGYHQTQAAPQMDLREKLKNLAKDPEAMAREIELAGEKRSLLETINLRGFLARFTGVSYMDHLERELTQCDIPLKPHEFLAVRAGGVVFAGIVGMTMSHNPIIALCCAGVAAFLHIPILKIKRSMRIDRFVTQLAEFLVLITNSLRSGQTFLQGVDIASKDSPNPNMLLRVPSEDLKIVMSAFSIQRNVGGNLADIMDQVAAMIRQRIAIQGQIKVLTTQGKLSGAIVGLLPFGLGTVIAIINPDYMAKLWTPRTEDGLVLPERYMGPIMMGIGIFMELLGCFVIYKICDIEV
jgi:tight adherence protein B